MDAANVVLDDNTITSHVKRIRRKFQGVDAEVRRRPDRVRHGLPLGRVRHARRHVAAPEAAAARPRHAGAAVGRLSVRARDGVRAARGRGGSLQAVAQTIATSLQGRTDLSVSRSRGPPPRRTRTAPSGSVAPPESPRIDLQAHALRPGAGDADRRAAARRLCGRLAARPGRLDAFRPGRRSIASRWSPACTSACCTWHSRCTTSIRCSTRPAATFWSLPPSVTGCGSGSRTARACSSRCSSPPPLPGR